MMTSTALLLLRDHSNGALFYPDTRQSIEDAADLEAAGLLTSERKGYRLTETGREALVKEERRILHCLAFQGMVDAEIAQRLNTVRLTGQTWTAEKIRFFLKSQGEPEKYTMHA